MKSVLSKIFKAFPKILPIVFLFSISNSADASQEKSFLQSATVHVSSQAQSSSEAREIAIKEGKKQAMVKALRKAIIKPEDLDFLLKDIENLSGKFTESYSLSKERISMIKYEADLTVNFYKDDLKNFLTTQNLEYIEYIPLNFLIIPIETKFFNSMNGNIWSTRIWTKTWEDIYNDKKEANINFKVAKGDFEDIANITISNLLYKKNPNTINQVLEKYQTTSILTVEVMNLDEQNLGIRITDLDDYKSYETSYTLNSDLPEDENYKSAANKAIEEIFKIAKTKNMNIESKEVKTDLEFYVSGLEDKLKVKQSLAKTKGITNFTEKKSSLKTVLFEITYNKNDEKKILEDLLSLKHNFMVLSKEINIQEKPKQHIPSQEEHLNSIHQNEPTPREDGENYIPQIQEQIPQDETLERLIVPEKAEYTF